MSKTKLETHEINTPVVSLIVNNFYTNIYCNEEAAIKAAKELELEDGSFFINELTEKQLIDCLTEEYEVADEEDLIKSLKAIMPHLKEFKSEEIRSLYNDILAIVDDEWLKDYLLNFDDDMDFINEYTDDGRNRFTLSSKLNEEEK